MKRCSTKYCGFRTRRPHVVASLVNLLPNLPFWAELLIFIVSAGIIWIAGEYLSDSTDVLAERLHLGQLSEASSSSRLQRICRRSLLLTPRRLPVSSTSP